MTSDSRPDPRDDPRDEQPAEPGTAAGDRTAAKRALRRELLAVRRALPAATVAEASQRVVAHLLGLPEVRQARSLLVYAADPDEIDLSVLLAGPPSGCSLLLPRVEGDALVMVRHSPGDALVVGALGVREPTGPSIDPGDVDVDVDVVIVPGVAFDAGGGRLGRGRGLYDRLLPGLPRAVRIGVCVERLVVAGLPLEAHDIRMDLVVSDASVRRRDAVDPVAPA